MMRRHCVCVKEDYGNDLEKIGHTNTPSTRQPSGLDAISEIPNGNPSARMPVVFIPCVSLSVFLCLSLFIIFCADHDQERMMII